MLKRWFPQWNTPTAGTTTHHVGFHDVLHLISRISMGDSYTILLNTLPQNQQQYVIRGTIACEREVSYMNELIEGSVGLDKYTIILYGKHGTDETPLHKRRQLMNLGFTRVYVYVGGLFEWALLQEIYGTEQMPTQGTPPRDLLQYAPPPMLVAGGGGGKYLTDH
jgi:hypothetical protein